MLFDKTKKSSFISSQHPNQFRKEKLSADALDHFAERYMLTEEYIDDTAALPYVMQNGKEIKISEKRASMEGRKTFEEHFKYLLAQTLPYHQPKDFKHSEYHRKDLLFIVDENGKAIPWTRDKKAIVQFTKIAEHFGFSIRSLYRS